MQTGRSATGHSLVDKSCRYVDAFRLWPSPLRHKNVTRGDGMKTLILALVVLGTGLPALAGGLSEPAMDPAVVEAQTASSGSDNWVGIVMTLLVFGAAVSN